MIERKYDRVPISAVATVTFEDENGNHSVETLVSSISFRGMGLYCDARIEEGTDVSTTINFISTGGAMEKALMGGHVLYNKCIGDLCYTGIQFDEEINSTNQPLLYEHIERRL